MSCYVMLEFTAKPGLAPMIVEALRKELQITRGKEGCQGAELTLNHDDPDVMLVVMRWQTRKHYEIYRAWRDAVGDAGKLAEVTTSGLSTRFFDVADG